jgi:ABC-type phosphate/phosphonate transport system substrate-binding protein
MYEAGPRVARAWRELFARVFAGADFDAQIVEHRWPLPIDELWSREDLGAAFMCGLPFVRSPIAMQAIAVPVPAPARYHGEPRYCSEFLVRAESGWTKLEDTFGSRFGWMTAASHSGYNAPRSHLALHVTGVRPALYSVIVGPLGTPARALDALREAEVDVTAIDSFYLDLLRRHEPSRLEGLLCVDTTAWSPMPLLVAAPSVPAADIQRLRRHLVSIHERPEYDDLRADVCLARFAAPRLDSYHTLEDMALAAAARGYETIR